MYLVGSTTCDDDMVDELNCTSRSAVAVCRSRTRSSSVDSLLDCSHTSARLALQLDVLPGSVKSGSLESLLKGMISVIRMLYGEDTHMFMVRPTTDVDSRCFIPAAQNFNRFKNRCKDHAR